MPSLIALVVGAVALPAVTILIVAAAEWVISHLRPKAQRRVRPWVWLSLACIMIAVTLIYPIVVSLGLSLRGADGSAWAGFTNFIWAFGTEMRPILLNNLLWLIVFPVGVTAVAVLMAVLLNKVRYEKVARVILILPTAVSFTAAAVTWRQMYTYAPAGRTQLGVFNAVLQAFGIEPVAWLARPAGADQWMNNLSLIMVAVWASLGIALLIITAAVKAVPQELNEAARLDGASEWGVFLHVTLPTIWPSVLTVITTQIMFALKIFDIVYIMTNGNNGTDVVANKLYNEVFRNPTNLGHAAAIAVLLLVAAIPVLWLNLRNMRKEGLT
ncbi:carbohydrate ABC transporter permease [Subtercola vilae]|uniref:Sugar ABC transporter permease n=1 Tax=Subtercola vilae TaxID=2056433 RepID=A0A4T2C0N5_9MICO|nr:sugar ABC transporter permease [Subtercola vilae]TIH36611.1 sugar ABC transporter permease [Subtercola vilae]